MLFYCAAVSVVLLVAVATPATARVRQTDNAIIVEVDDVGERNERYMDPLVSAIYRYPGSTFLMDSRTCWTPDGRLGACGSIRSCYPNFRLTGMKDVASSAVLMHSGTCQYVQQDGRPVYGICCARQSTMPASTFPMFSGMFPFPPISVSAASTGFPFWPFGGGFYPFPGAVSPIQMPAPVISTNPVQIPQQPQTPTPAPTTQSTTLATQPVVWQPVTESPTQSTTQAPTQTTPQSTTTAPWWTQPTTQSSTQTTTRSTTTSPWWTQPTTQSSTQTTTRSTTTSPWWTPKPTTPPTVATEPSASSSSKSCGAGPYKTLSIDEQSRIVGGQNAIPNSWPFIVSIQAKGKHFCGGSLYSDTHILTAAHCIATFTSSDVSRMEIIFGMHSISGNDPRTVRTKVRRVTRHKGFDARTLYNDIAILTLAQPVKFTEAISPVCLPPAGSNDLHVGKEATIIGWGTIRFQGPQPRVLQQVTVQVQSNAQCSKNYGNDAPGGIKDHMMCAGLPGKDSCQGDSGGPLVMQASPGDKWTLHGVVSWGIECSKPPYPGVYTRVSYFMDWIQKNTQN